ncbi:MAG TPA: MATE family efflux transporter [Chloroflexota bacterium]|nr:MATE family efflux transporter [Chloroflexota bacterium]
MVTPSSASPARSSAGAGTAAGAALVPSLPVENIGPLVGRLAWPVIAEQLLQTLVGVVDMAMVGRLGAAAVAGVGTSTQLLQLAISAMGAVSVGTTVLVARATGARQYRQAAHITRQSLLAGALMGIVLGLAGWLLARPLIRLLGPEAEVVEQGAIYLAISSAGSPALVLMLVAGGAFRGAGDARTPLLASAGMNLVNLVVAYVLVFGVLGFPALGIAGSAAGGVAGRLAGAALLLGMLARGGGLADAPGRRWRIDLDVLRRVLRIGIPTAVEQTMLSAGFLLYGAMVIGLGTTVYATQRITFQAINLAFMPAFGFATATTTLTGQSLGAAQPERVPLISRSALRQALFWMILAGVLFAVLAEPVMRLFTADAAVVELGRVALPVLALAQPFWAVGQVYAGTLRGAGDARFPMLATSAGMWLVRLPLAYLFGIVLGWGLPGVYLSSTFDAALRAVLNYYRYRSGRWRRTQV